MVVSVLALVLSLLSQFILTTASSDDGLETPNVIDDNSLNTTDPADGGQKKDIQSDVIDILRKIKKIDWEQLADRNIFVLLGSLLCLFLYIVFLAYYLSRLTGFLVSVVANRFFLRGPGSPKCDIGSFSASPLSGKIMFRNLNYLSHDYSVRIKDGWVQFHYWKWYGGVQLGQDMASQPARISCQLNGLEVHAYNQLSKYREISCKHNISWAQALFSQLGQPTDPKPDNDEKGARRQRNFLSLVPKVRYEVNSGRLVLGSNELPTAVVVSFEQLVGHYTNKPPSNGPQSGDLFMVAMGGSCENFRISLVENTIYTARTNCRYEQPPRTMGEGFEVLQTASISYIYNQDILGTVKTLEQKLDECVPCWKSELRLGKNTVISYGPWADKQRDLIYNFFYPPPYWMQKQTFMPLRGEPRVPVKFDLRVLMMHDSTLEFLFMRRDQPNAVHVGVKQSSSVEIVMPWTVAADGYHSRISGELLNVDATTSLEYQNLVECQSLNFNCFLRYPIEWNAHQQWDFNLDLKKCSCWLLYAHKDYIQDLLEEWSADSPSDIFSFIPYTWTFNVNICDFELLLALNQFNWLDTSSSLNAENQLVALCGRKLFAKCDMSFTEFVEDVSSLEFSFSGDTLGLRALVPEQAVMHPVLQTLHEAAHLPKHFITQETLPLWHGATTHPNWLDLCRAAKGQVTLRYNYHPMYKELVCNLPEESEHKAVLLRPWTKTTASQVDVDSLEPDCFLLNIEVSEPQLLLNGFVVKALFLFKENYVGEAQDVRDIKTFENQQVTEAFGHAVEEFVAEKYRPLQTILRIELNRAQALCQLCSDHNDVGDRIPCPILELEQFAFEMDKRYRETTMQLGLSPASIYFHTFGGVLRLSALQFRGHGMFSGADLPIDSPTLEYSWLMELMIGDLTGQLHPSHLLQVGQFLDAFLLMLLADEEDLEQPKSLQLCQHMKPKELCDRVLATDGLQQCLGESQLKYVMFRLCIDEVRLLIKEEHSGFDLKTWPFRMSLCNVHSAINNWGISVQLPKLVLRQFMTSADQDDFNWLECGHVRLQQLKVDISLPLDTGTAERWQLRQRFLRTHDTKTRRLTFLWDRSGPGCGCVGGCKFMGDNIYGNGFFNSTDTKLAVVAVEEGSDSPRFGQSILPGRSTLVDLSANVQKNREPFGSVDRTPDDVFFETCEMVNASEGELSRRPSSVESFHTTVEEPDINLYSQVNRPVLNSPLLMTHYARYLKQHQTILGPKLALFEMTKDGLNDISLERDRLKSHRFQSPSKSILKPPKAGMVEVLGSLGDQVDLFLSPIGIEGMQRLLDACSRQLTRLHPAFILQHMFASCSGKWHRQPLVTFSSGQKTENFTNIQLHLSVPSVNCAIFQCGLVEKTIPFADLEQAHSLVQPSMLLATANRLLITATTAHPQKLKVGNCILGRIEIDSSHCQLLQVTGKSSTNIGLSKQSSKFRYTSNWTNLALSDEFDLCLVMEAGLPGCSAMFSRPLNFPIKQVTDVVKLAEQHGANRMSQPEPERVRHASEEDTEPKTRLTVKIGKIQAYFGLCQPVEASNDSWPLYDVLAPGLSAWIHVSHRLVVSCTAISNAFDLWMHLTLAKLLTDAFDCRVESVFVPPKSKFAAARIRRRYLQGCPSCQVLLTLLKYLAYVGMPAHYQQRTLQCGNELCNASIRRKALVVLFSHWQTLLAGEKLVTLIDPKAAKKYEMKQETTKKKVSVSPAEPSTASSDSSAPELVRQGSAPVPTRHRSSMERRSLKEVKERQRPGIKRHSLSTPSATGSPHASLQKQQQQLTGEFDLYNWMRQQHRQHRKSNERTDDRDTTENLMDIMLNVCFWPMFKGFDLDPPGVRLAFMEMLGSSVNFTAEIQGCEVDVVEPKFLATTRVGHKYHQFLRIEPITATGQIEYGGEDALHVKRAALNVNYHLGINNIKLYMGLPAVSFIYQLSFAIKSCLDTRDELEDAYSRAEMGDRKQSVHHWASLTNSEGSAAEWAGRLLDKVEDYQRSENRRSMLFEDDQGGMNAVIFGLVELKQIVLDATLTELFVTVQFNKLQLGLSYKTKELADGLVLEGDISFTASLRRAMLILLQHATNTESTRTIFSLTVKENHVLLTRVLRSGNKWQNSVLVEIGPIEGDIPMHPGFLHEVVKKHGPQLNEQIERFATAVPQTVEEEVILVRRRPMETTTIGQYSRSMSKSGSVAVANFNVTLMSLKISAALLPSLKATYQLDTASSSGTTGSEAKFSVTVPTHGITFVVHEEQGTSAGQIVPIKIDLPKLTASGAYIEARTAASMLHSETPRGEGLVYQEGGYLKIDVFVGKFEHTLTTDLLNQLLFVQEAFRRELGDILAKITAERVPLVQMPRSSSSANKPLLYSLEVKGDTTRCIQVTATTPTSVAVRLAVDHLHCQLTNRWVQKRSQERERLFGSAQIQLSLALGQLVKNALFEEVEPEFQKYAHFVTQISAQNVETKEDEHAYTYLINVNRPMIFVQPIAVDKAVLLWLNYKNTYEFWNAQRQKIVQHKTHRLADVIKTSGQQLLDRDEARQFLKFSVVNGLHICMPLYSAQFPDANAALMIELDKTEIAVYAHKDMVSRGSFSGFRIQFSEDYDGTPDNWRPSSTNLTDSNFCYFPEGTYDVFSRTSGPREEGANAEWLLNVIWKVQGMQLDVNNRIGKLTSLLVRTLTSMATDTEEPLTAPGSSRASHAADSDVVKDLAEPLIDELAEVHKLPPGKARSCLLEQKMHDQSVLVSDLQQCQASEATVEIERRKLKQLEAALFREFRQEMVDKWRRQSQKATLLRDHLGLAVKPAGGQKPKDARKAKPLRRRQSDIGRKKAPMLRMHPRTTSVDVPGSSLLPTIISRDVSRDTTPSSSRSLSDDDEFFNEQPTDSSLDEGNGVYKRAARAPTVSVDVGNQPAVDLYLDIQFNVASGTWTFRTPPPKNGGSEQKGGSAKSKKTLRATVSSMPAPPTRTSIEMPSLDVCAYYTSRSGTDDTAPSTVNVERLKSAQLNSDVIEHMLSSTKKANFYMWMSLASMPAETVITPHVLDFVELTLEPLPPAESLLPRSASKQQMQPNDNETEAKTMSLTDTAVTGSFPVDVVLCVSVQSSQIRFKTEEQTRMTVDCLLRLPQLKLVATSRKSEYLTAIPKQASKILSGESTVSEGTLCGGICVSASLTGFSLRIYCPLSDEKRYAVDVTIDTITLSLTRGSNQLSMAEKELLKNSVKFSLLADIDKAKFCYDMRRLKELLLFPKYWYRRAIMRRLFLGDESELKRNESDIASPSKDASPKMPEHKYSVPRLTETDRPKQRSSWEAVVLYGISCQELYVQAHMSNTMGNTTWITNQVQCLGQVAVNSLGSKNLSLTFTLLDSALEATGGLISGAVSLRKFSICGNHKKTEGSPPQESIQTSLDKADARIEWMGTTIFLGRCTNLRLGCQDEWESIKDSQGCISRALLFVHMNCVLGEMHLMITKTTVNDFEKIVNKLKLFFEEQLKSGMIVWSFPVSFGQETKPTVDLEPPDVEQQCNWHRALEMLTEVQLKSNFFKLPTGKEGVTIVGANLQICGEEIALACMTDKLTNSHDWAVFHLRQPRITFSPEAQYVFIEQRPEEDEIEDSVGILLRQELHVKLGRDSLQRDVTETKAMFARAQRSRYTPLGGMGTQRLDQWLDYLLDSVLRQVYPEERAATWAQGSENYAHSVLQLLRFPPLDATLTCIQEQKPSSMVKGRPVVRCSFITQFQDHIYIQTNTNALFGFLPTLLKGYLSQTQAPPGKETKKGAGPVVKDQRSFVCETWVVEPNIRFLDKVKWDPPGVDLLLQKLGILDQRNTIPKWAQRGFMDPCDFLLAIIVERVLKIANKGISAS